jgi:hypothetical protein
LRYASEGGALVFHPRAELGRLNEAVEGPSRSPRPEPWNPYVFVNPEHARTILPGRFLDVRAVSASEA